MKIFGKKKEISIIDRDQLQLIKKAQKRIRQKKRLYIHFVIFLIGIALLSIINIILEVGKNFTIAGINWFVYAILIWLFFFSYHFISVFITTKFMGKDWEKQQLEKLVNRQEQRIEKLKQQFLKEETKIAQTQAYSEARIESEASEKIPSKKLTIIVAAGENNAIGKDNTLIWHLSDDLKRFKRLTNGHHIIMGRKTFESFPKPLPNRTHIVITRQTNYKVPKGIIIVNTIEDAIDAAKKDKQPFIIGGGEIYKQSLALVDKLEITRVHTTFKEADTFFPEIDKTKWREVSRTIHKIDEKHANAFSFITYVRQ